MGYKLMRKIRINNKISTAELSRHCGIRQQHISDIELGKRSAGMDVQTQLQHGFRCVLAARQQALSQLKKDFEKHKDHLLDYTEETL